MYIYSVTININKETEQEWLQYMQTIHIAEVMSTGYFKTTSMRKGITYDENEYSIYNIEYTIDTKEDFTNYQLQCAPALQKEVIDKFAGKFTVQRMFYTVLFEQ